MLRRLIGTGALVLSAGALLSGCSVPENGWMGVGRSDQGEFRVYLRTCGQTLDGATLYWPNDPIGDSEGEIFGEWSFRTPQPAATGVHWPLQGQARGAVIATRPVAALPVPPKNMAIYAWTRDASASAGGPYLFTQADLEKLTPGQILITNDTGKESDPPNKAISRSQFEALDCAVFG